VSADPFGTDELRRAVLQAWRSSPTRFREDANSEEDLVLGGYRDRWFIELAQNAADAAHRAGMPGELRVSVVDGELRVANTGEPLDTAGVAALASLRASAKRDTPTVGRFGIGFAAVLPVSTEPRVVSRSGGVAFSQRRTRQIVDGEPRLRDEATSRAGRVPVLRLVWPTDPGEAPPAGFDTEVRLPLRATVDVAALLSEAAAEATDLLLALPALQRIDVGGRVYRRREPTATDGPTGVPGLGAVGGERGAEPSSTVVVLDEPDGSTRWRLVRRDGELPAELVTTADERHRPHWSVCWAVPVLPSGQPRSVGPGDVLHAPTPTDERLSLPARLLVTLPMEPSRRRIRHGAAADYVLAEAVRAYPALVAALPAEHRTALVPHAGFPRSDVDAALRDGVIAALRAAAWLPAADGTVVSPAKACVLDSPAPRLVELLADLVPGLGAAPLSEPARAAAMVVLGVPRLGLAGVVSAVSGLLREPGWWHALYDVLAPLVDVDPSARDELAALPVPLADGRTVTGPRGTLVVAAGSAHPGTGLRIVHPDAVHPLLLRLGAQRAGPRELLDSPALREAVERSVDDAEAGSDTAPLAGTVLALVTAAGTDHAAAQPWLGGLALPDETGEPRRADELVLPDGALRAVLSPDSPIGVLHEAVAAAYSREALRAVGVLDGFAVVVDDNPTAPDHDLPDEEQWWASLDEPPRRLVAVRDLDLVDGAAWPAALRLLAAGPSMAGTGSTSAAGETGPERTPDGETGPERTPDGATGPERTPDGETGPGWTFGDETGLSWTPYDPDADTRRALHEPYTRWWLARHARLAGHPPRHWRLAGATRLAGLYDPVPDGSATGLDDDLLAIAGVRTELSVADAEDAADLLARLADETRRPSPATVRAAHAALTAAAADGRFDVDDLDLPAAVRTISGATADAAGTYVLDLPWLAGIADADRAVAGGDPYLLADLLDLPLASEQLAADVTSTGHPTPWTDLPEVAAACEATGRDVPPGTVTLHDRLTVRTSDGQEHAVPYWVDGGVGGGGGTVHAADPVRALLWYGATGGTANRG
jgi:hypothetical protein